MLFKTIKKLALLVLPAITLAADLEVAMFVTEGSDPDRYKSAVKACTDYNIPLKEIDIPKEGLKGSITDNLYIEENGMKQPKYKVLLFPNGRVSYEKGERWRSAITQEQWLEFEEYARINDARLVYLNEYPSAETGTKLYKECEKDCKYELTQELEANEYCLLGEEINKAKLNTYKIYHFPAVVDTTVTGVNPQPIMTFGPVEPDYPDKTVAAVTANKNGAQLIAFYMAFGDWSKDSSALNIVWLSWATGIDIKHFAGNSVDSQSAIHAAASGDKKNVALEIILITFSTIFTIFLTIY